MLCGISETTGISKIIIPLKSNPPLGGLQPAR
jgi:hypothetical protein